MHVLVENSSYWFLNSKLVEHRAAMREVGSSTLIGPTLRVLKLLRRKCCLCNYTRKWLDFQVFSDKDYKP